MKKLAIVLLCFCSVLLLGAAGIFGGTDALADDGQFKVVATQCLIYQDASFSSPLLDQQGQPIVLKHGDLLTQADGGVESQKFVYVNFQDVTGYVFKYYLSSNFDDQVVYPVFNARVVAQEAEVFYDLERHPAEMTLEKGHELYLYEGYQKKNDLTAVCFVAEDQTLFYGYIQTKDLEPYGVNGWVITGILVAVSCITIILLLVFMKKKKVIKKED